MTSDAEFTGKRCVGGLPAARMVLIASDCTSARHTHADCGLALAGNIMKWIAPMREYTLEEAIDPPGECPLGYTSADWLNSRPKGVRKGCKSLTNNDIYGHYPNVRRSLMRTFLYARVSDASQTIEHQWSQAEAAGFKIDEVIADQGVSGITTKLADRPGGRRLLDKVRPGDQVICRWVDRLGRNYDDATATIRHLMNEGVVVKTVINTMVFDGSATDPIQKAVRDAMIAFMAATAQAQAEATKAAQKAGIAHAKQKAEIKYKGRKPSYTRAQFDIVRTMLDQQQGISSIAKAAELSRQTIYRIERDPVAAEAVLMTWSR
jgi:putative DNA-invertase from lambdoid prophage Rac